MTRCREPSLPSLLLALASITACISHPEATMSRHEHHTIDYIELTVNDLSKAQEFYGAAFGWRFNSYGPDYAGIVGRGSEVGGLRVDPKYDGVRGGALVVLYSEDLESSVKAVRTAGGEVVVEPFDFPGGRRFHFLDPSGNELAVWAAAETN